MRARCTRQPTAGARGRFACGWQPVPAARPRPRNGWRVGWSPLPRKPPRRARGGRLRARPAATGPPRSRSPPGPPRSTALRSRRSRRGSVEFAQRGAVRAVVAVVDVKCPRQRVRAPLRLLGDFHLRQLPRALFRLSPWRRQNARSIRVAATKPCGRSPPRGRRTLRLPGKGRLPQRLPLPMPPGTPPPSSTPQVAFHE